MSDTEITKILGLKREREKASESESSKKRRKLGPNSETDISEEKLNITGHKRPRTEDKNTGQKKSKKVKKSKNDSDDGYLSTSSESSSSASSLSSSFSSISSISSISSMNSSSNSSRSSSDSSLSSKSSEKRDKSSKSTKSTKSKKSNKSNKSQTLADKIARTPNKVNKPPKAKSNTTADDDDAFSELSFSSGKDQSDDDDSDEGDSEDEVESHSSRRSKAKSTSSRSSSRHFDEDSDDERDGESGDWSRTRTVGRDNLGDGKEKKWVPCIAPDKLKVLEAFGPPPPRNECFACRKSSPKAISFASEPFDSIITMIKGQIHYSDLIDLTEEVHSAFENKIRIPCNAEAATRGLELIPVWTKASIYGHLSDHMLMPDFQFHYLLKRTLAMVHTFIDTQVYERNVDEDDEDALVQYRVRTKKDKDEVNPISTLKELINLARSLYSVDPKKMFGYNEDMHINSQDSHFVNPEKATYHRGEIKTNMHSIQ